MAGRWVFGYGSLVSPTSFGATLGRELRPGRDLFEAELVDYGRRWNYGVMHTEGTTTEPDYHSFVSTLLPAYSTQVFLYRGSGFFNSSICPRIIGY